MTHTSVAGQNRVCMFLLCCVLHREVTSQCHFIHLLILVSIFCPLNARAHDRGCLNTPELLYSCSTSQHWFVNDYKSLRFKIHEAVSFVRGRHILESASPPDRLSLYFENRSMKMASRGKHLRVQRCLRSCRETYRNERTYIVEDLIARLAGLARLAGSLSNFDFYVDVNVLQKTPKAMATFTTTLT